MAENMKVQLESRDHDVESSSPNPKGGTDPKAPSQPFVGSLMEHLVNKKIITMEIANKVAADRHSANMKNKQSVVDVLSDSFGISKEVLYDQIAEFYSFRIADVSARNARRFSPRAMSKLLSCLPENMYKLALKFKVLPYELAPNRSDKLVIATPYPSAREIHEIARAFPYPKFEICYIREREYAEVWRAVALERQRPENGIANSGDDLLEESDEVLESILEKEINRGELQRLVENLLDSAVRVGASDIHFRPQGIRKTAVNFRVDGILTEWFKIEGVRAEAVTAVVKGFGHGLDRFDRMVAQDGSAQKLVDDEMIRYRVSVLPMVSKEQRGQFESIVLRVLRDAGGVLSVDQIGFDDYSYRMFTHAISQPDGMITLTGPTGSGKSTTLVAALRAVMSPEVNTISVEDPVEYLLDGALQVKLSHKLGFEDALRAILRHDPDIVMVGEIRDRITADIAIKLANTGHLTFSTLHTNDATTVVSRLFKIGVEPFLIAQSMNIVVAQRLVRKLCEKCKVQVAHPPDVALAGAGFSKEEIESATFFKPVGCTYCNKGYRGRTAIHESLFFTPEVRNIILESGDRVDVNAIRESALGHGMKTLRRSGLDLVKKGISTVDEILANTTSE